MAVRPLKSDLHTKGAAARGCAAAGEAAAQKGGQGEGDFSRAAKQGRRKGGQARVAPPDGGHALAATPQARDLPPHQRVLKRGISTQGEVRGDTRFPGGAEQSGPPIVWLPAQGGGDAALEWARRLSGGEAEGGPGPGGGGGLA